MRRPISGNEWQSPVLARSFSFGAYIHGDSVIHRIDPRVKIIASVLLGLMTFRSNWNVLALLTIFFTVITLLGRITFDRIRSAMKPFFYFAMLLFLLHIFFTDGESLISAGVVNITQEGLLKGTYVLWQYLVLFYSGFILTVTTSPSALVAGFSYLLGPLRRIRIPVQELAIMVVMALRFVPVFVDEYSRVRLAHISRGGEVFEGNLKTRIVRAGRMTVPLMIGAVRRAEELALAIDARGFGTGQRTYLNELRFTSRDLTAVCVVVALVLCGTLLC